MALILEQGMVLAGAALVLGAVLALLATRFVERLLFGVAPSDPLTYGVVLVTLTIVAFAAISLPARRALRTDPMMELRVN